MIGAPAAGEGSLRYSHTQIGWWMLGILGVSAVVALAAIRAAAVRAGGVPPVLVGVVLVILVVAIGLFSSLNVRVTEQSVVWRFGPGLFGGRIPLAEIDDVTVGRTPLWAGLGIHWIWSGWVYNVSGRGAVRIERRGGGTTWLGSDEPEALRDAIESARRR